MTPMLRMPSLRPWAIFAAVSCLAAVTAGADMPAGGTPLYLLHVPGIGGERSIDRTLVGGLRQGGVQGQVEIHDWTGQKPGIGALQSRELHVAEARKIAARVAAFARAHPGVPIYLTCHSGGAGLAVWAMEQLPEDVMVESVLMLAPALSPGYDLSKALRHVRGRMYVFSSANDGIVLGAGTKLFGTIDGVKSEAAGMVGFVRPDQADGAQYEKLVPQPYDSMWLQWGNYGDHVGPMGTRFAREYLAGVLLGRAAIATQPAQPQADTATQRR